MIVAYTPPENPEGTITITLTETEAKILASRGTARLKRVYGIEGLLNSNTTLQLKIVQLIRESLDLPS